MGAPLAGFSDPAAFAGNPQPPAGFSDPAEFANPFAPSKADAWAARTRELAASDQPVVDEGIGPLELLVGAGTFKPGLAAANRLTKAAPWLIQAMTRGGLLGAGQGAIHAAAMGHENPTGDVLAGAAGGAVFGPAVEAIGGAIGPRLAALRRGRGGAPPPAAPPAPAVSPVETPAATMPVKPHPELAPAEPVTVQGVPETPARPLPHPEINAARRMSGDELAAASEAVKGDELQSAIDVFGEEGAARYEQLQRTRNRVSASDAAQKAAGDEIDAMEANLTAEQKKRLFGIGLPDDRVYDHVELRRAASEARLGYGDATDDELGNAVARTLTEGKPESSLPDFVRLREQLREYLGRGKTEQDLLSDIARRARGQLADPEDQRVLMERAARVLREAMGGAPEPAAAPPLLSAAPEPAVAPPMAAPEPTPGAAPPATGGAPPPATVGPVAPKPNTGPVDVTNRQQFPLIEDIRATIKDDPEYAKRLAALGGGQPVANSETLAKALEAGPMHPDELAAWPMGAPVDHVTQTRGLMTFDYFQQKWLRAVASYDGEGAGQALEEIRRLLPGVENMRGEAGRTLQAQGMFVRDELWRAMQDLQDLQAKGVPLEQAQAMAREIQERAAAAIGPKPSAAEQSLLDHLTTAATFMKLTSPVTHLVNTTSNALTFVGVRQVEKAATAAAYLRQGDVAAARAEVDFLFGTTMGFRSGIRRYMSLLMDEAPEVSGAAGEVHSKNIPLPRWARPLDVFRQLSAADGFWKALLEDARLHELASRSARRAGLTGDALAAKVNEMVAARPDAWVKEAQAYAKEFTFQEGPDRFLKGIQVLQNWPLVKWFVPFTSTPYNLSKFQFQRSAAGILSPRNFNGLRAGGQQQAEAVGRLTVGALFGGGALALVSTVPTTGAYPKDPNERAKWRANNIQPFSIKLPNGTWVNYARFAPVGTYIGQAVMLRDAIQNKDDKKAEEIAASLAASSIKMVGEQPFLSGMSALFKMIDDPEKKAGSFVQGVATGFVPNILRDVRTQTDDNVRVVHGIREGVQNMIPGLSDKLPAQIDALGNEVKYDNNRLVRASKVLSSRSTQPEARLMVELDWSPSPVSDVLEKKGYPKRKLTPDELERYQREVGSARAAAIRRLMSRSSFSAMDVDEKKAKLTKETKEAADTVRERWKRELFNHRSRGAAQEVAR